MDKPRGSRVMTTQLFLKLETSSEGRYQSADKPRGYISWLLDSVQNDSATVHSFII
uniref:Uncharacterized protein n=1 Tax=Arundo donax TaxID=35708 RepID=A0A0A9EX52_ARUDO